MGGSGRKEGGRRRKNSTSTPKAASRPVVSDLDLDLDFEAYVREGQRTELDDAWPSKQQRSHLRSGTSEIQTRSFSHAVKQQCWDKAQKVKGRDPDRWRRDALGNLVFRKLVGCPGCLCHDYDHILPYSKGGKSTLDNCQVLQATVNRSKGNQTEISKADLIQKSAYCRVSGRDMDLLELSAYGNVRRGQDSGGCNIQ